MKAIFEKFQNLALWKRALLFLAVLGPGFITANVDNDAGGIATYSIAGAQFGYALVWSMVPITIALVVVQEMSARMAVATGKGLADLIRENFGVKTTFYLMLTLFVVNIGNVMAEFSGIGVSLGIFGIAHWYSVPISALLVWLVVLKGNYKSLEKIMLFACLFYVAYLFSGFMAKPDWGEVVKQSVWPEVQWNFPYTVMLVGLVGTTIAPWMQFYLQSSIVEKGVTVEEYKLLRLDVIIGCIIAPIVAFFIVLACAATLHKHGIVIHSAEDAAVALRPFAGSYASLLFAFGLFNASIFAACVLPLSTAYSICEGMGWEAGVSKRFEEAPQFFWLYAVMILIGAGAVLIPHFPVWNVMYLSQVGNGVLLPLILFYVLRLVNDKEVMGEFVNTKNQNIVAWLTISVVSVLTLMMVVFSLAGAV